MAASATPDALTPYDTGERLEPQLWPADDDPDRYGRVDFDDDEGATIVSAHGERLPTGDYRLVVTRVSDVRLVVDIDGTRTPLVSPAVRNQEDN